MDSKGRPKHPKSLPKHNFDGLTEQQLGVLRRQDQGVAHKMKRRNLKDLPSDMRAEIVRLYDEEHLLQKEISQRFRITQSLVGHLVQDSVKRPEKLRNC